MERKMASLQVIQSLSPIDGADRIEIAKVQGWNVIVNKGLYQPNDLAVYCEIDSFIPVAVAPFLVKPGKTPKTFNDVEGSILKTMKMKGVVSQGLILPLSLALDIFEGSTDDVGQELCEYFCEGTDVSNLLNIQKYEPPEEIVHSNAKGNFPHFIPKTAQERVQNTTKSFDKWKEKSTLFEVTEKLDGSSMTVFTKDGVVGVCSRNLELKEEEGGTFWETAKSADIDKVLVEVFNTTNQELAIQGELCGPGIQGNKYQLDKFNFFVYDIYSITSARYLTPTERMDVVTSNNLQHCPVIGVYGLLNDTIESLIEKADGVSVLCNQAKREGFVFKALDEDNSFKVISNAWLLKHDN